MVKWFKRQNVIWQPIYRKFLGKPLSGLLLCVKAQYAQVIVPCSKGEEQNRTVGFCSLILHECVYKSLYIISTRWLWTECYVVQRDIPERVNRKQWVGFGLSTEREKSMFWGRNIEYSREKEYTKWNLEMVSVKPSRG